MLEMSKSGIQSGLALAYQPILRGYFGLATAYYAVMLISHFWFVEPENMTALVGASGVAVAVLGSFYFRLMNRRSVQELELLTLLANTTMIVNVVVALSVEFSETKLSYFIMAVMIFALTAISLRQATVSILVAFAALASQLHKVGDESQITFGFVGFAAAMSGLTIAHLLRKVIEKAIDARIRADAARADAEENLEGEKTLGETLRKRSLSDSLTGLSNRRGFYGALKHARADRAQHGDLWLALLDLDGFKTINDTFGHLAGDELLKSVAERLRIFCAGRAHVSRMGGDEFSVVFEGAAVDLGPEEWCEDLLECISKVYVINGRLINISGSIGCYRVSEDEHDNTPIRKADFALLHAKKMGKNRVVMFGAEHAEAEAERHRVEHALRTAHLEQEIELVFQPQVDVNTQQMVRAEVLARWNSPVLGMVSPDRFIKVAEECGLIADISITVLTKAIEALKERDAAVPLAINLSGNDLASTQTMDAIIAILESAKVPTELLEFEVTETAMLTDHQRAADHMVRLSELGCSVAIDDFGTGYSNFGYLRSLPIDKLKIDRSFLKDLGDPMTEKVLRSLVGMAKTLGVQCVLEGVEDEIGLLMAKRSGADVVQGYLTGKPVSEAELFRWKSKDDRLSLPTD